MSTKTCVQTNQDQKLRELVETRSKQIEEILNDKKAQLAAALEKAQREAAAEEAGPILQHMIRLLVMELFFDPRCVFWNNSFGRKAGRSLATP